MGHDAVISSSSGSGTVDVLVDGEIVATLRAGDYFGEIAALEWGAGFARSRAATVVARDDVRLRVLEPRVARVAARASSRGSRPSFGTPRSERLRRAR